MAKRDYAFAGSEINGLQIVDITNPERARIATTFDCAISQGDPQVFKRGSRTLLTYTNEYEDTKAAANSRCYRQADALGFDAIAEDGNARLGTLIIDVSRPRHPTTVSFVRFDRQGQQAEATLERRFGRRRRQFGQQRPRLGLVREVPRVIAPVEPGQDAPVVRIEPGWIGLRLFKQRFDRSRPSSGDLEQSGKLLII